MKTLDIEWRHLVEKGQTCDRCADTGQVLQQIIDRLNRECLDRGCQFQLIEIPLDPERIHESNLVLIEGTPIEELLPGSASGSSHCTSCCELLGEASHCRTVQFGGAEYESLPESLLHRAICQVAACC
jgi:hypothetical protein